MSGIRIYTLECGTVSLRPFFSDIKENRFSQNRITFPNNAFLIEHPVHGLILVDTGWSADCTSLLPKHLVSFYRPEIRPDQTAKARLAALGIAPEDINLVLLTHLDADHTCALKDFAGKCDRMACAELEYFYSCRTVYRLRQASDTWMPYADKIEKIHYYGCSLGPAGRGFDLFGDDSILCIYTPGHTDGIFTTLISQEPSNRFNGSGDGVYGGDYAVIASDVAFSVADIDSNTIPGYGFDRKQQLNSIRFLKELRSDPRCKAILCSHEKRDTTEPCSI